MMPMTPFSKTDQLIALKTFAQGKHLTTIDQLKRLGRIKFGTPPAAQSRYAGYPGLQQAYGLTNLEIVSLDAGASIYAALDSQAVQIAEAISTDPQLAGGAYAMLGDPKNLFGFQHVALIINTSLLNRLGSAFQHTYTSVTKLLTVDAMRSLNAAVVLQGKIPASVAHAFLVANHLLSS